MEGGERVERGSEENSFEIKPRPPSLPDASPT